MTGSVGRGSWPPASPADEAGPARREGIHRETVVEATARAIRNAILGGTYAAGAALRQEALAAELKVSRSPVREALRRLEAEGFVTFHPHQGATVSILTVEQIRELFELWALIESDLLQRAVPHATAEDVARAERVLWLYAGALERGDVSAWSDLSWRFHAALFRAAGRPVSAGVLRTLHDNGKRYMHMEPALVLAHAQGDPTAAHRAILEAVRDRDVARAQVLTRSLILSAGRRITGWLETRSSALAEG